MSSDPCLPPRTMAKIRDIVVRLILDSSGSVALASSYLSILSHYAKDHKFNTSQKEICLLF